MLKEFTYIDHDRSIWEKELEEFVPATIYDMHVHMWSNEHKGTAPDHPLMLPIGHQDHLDWAAKVFPGREMHYLDLATPIVGMDAEGHNDWCAEQLKGDPESAFNMMVTPDMSAEYIAEQVKKHSNILGLKCYRTFAPDKDDGRIHEYLPEHQIELAHDMGLAITLHLSKRTGAADADNQKDLERSTKKYPGAQWILAHCARAFNAFMMEEAIHFLTGLPNIWYDTSAVNDMYSHFLLMKHEDRSRVMFGTDNIVAGCTRGKYVTWGRAWEYFPGNDTVTHCDPTPTLVCYEQLRQERQVADMLGLTQQEIDDHFFGNAKRFIAQIRANR